MAVSTTTFFYLCLLAVDAGNTRADRDAFQASAAEPALQPEIAPVSDYSRLTVPPQDQPGSDRGRHRSPFIYPVTTAARLYGVERGAPQGHVVLADTYHGMRLVAAFRALPAGHYTLWVDDQSHISPAGKEGGGACTAGKSERSKQGTWTLTSFDVGESGTAKLDLIFPGRGDLGGYTVPVACSG
jgi:hypothetical protein